MFTNTSTQSQDLFKDCLGFARHLSKSPGLYCRLEIKLGKKSFNFQTRNFPAKRKSPSDYRRDQKIRETWWKGDAYSWKPWSRFCSSWRLYRNTERNKLPELHPLLLAEERYPGQSIYSLLQIYPSWMEQEVFALKRNYVSKYQPPLLRPCSPLWLRYTKFITPNPQPMQNM